jgi:hypothetical protein
MANELEPVDAEFVASEGQETALAVPQAVAPLAIFQTQDPVEVIEKATRVANALKAVMVQKNLVKHIQGKEYPLVEAWQLAAAMLNLNPIIESTARVENGWEAVCVLHNGLGRLVGRAEAQCLATERTWKDRDDFARRSMAQTRATGKALRASLGFIMTLAGYEATPAEEMDSAGPGRAPFPSAPRAAEAPTAPAGSGAPAPDGSPTAEFKRRRRAMFISATNLGVKEATLRARIKAKYGVESTDELFLPDIEDLIKDLPAMLAEQEAEENPVVPAAKKRPKNPVVSEPAKGLVSLADRIAANKQETRERLEANEADLMAYSDEVLGAHFGDTFLEAE